VLEHIRLGESNKVIARRLGMTEGTVKVHIRQMMRKCRVSNRTQLALGGNPSAEAVE
jgi:two-component system nitrate/nitrite response regulator NarL